MDIARGKTKLTEKEEAFCQGYLVDFNATRAAKAAGYSPNSATEIGSENLRKPHIQQRISQLRAEMGKNFNITKERIARELARIAFSDLREIFDDMGDLLPVKDWPDDIAAAIGSVEVDVLYDYLGHGEKVQKGYTKKVKPWEKTKAIEALNRMMGFNAPDKVAPTDPEGNALQQPMINIQVIQPGAAKDSEKIE